MTGDPTDGATGSSDKEPEDGSEGGNGDGSIDGPVDAIAPDPRVRVARPVDADRIRELQSHLRQPSPDLLEYGLVVGTTFVSVADGHVVGYLLPVDAPNRAGVHIAELVVDPRYRREGRARGLLAAVVDDASGAVTLQAHPDNDAALALYDEFGFAVVDRREDAYADGDALVLRRG